MASLTFALTLPYHNLLMILIWTMQHIVMFSNVQRLKFDSTNTKGQTVCIKELIYIYLLSEWKGQREKYLALGQDIIMD